MVVVSPVMDCCPAQGVPHLVPQGSWDWLQLLSAMDKQYGK